MTELSNVSSDYEVIKSQLVNEMNSTSDAFNAIYPSATANLLADMLAGVSALWNHKIEQAALNLFMESAYGYQTVYALAKTKGYTPANKLPASVFVKFNVSPDKFTSITPDVVFMIGDYEYYATQVYTSEIGSSELTVVLTQGSTVTESFVASGTPYESFTISNNYEYSEGTLSVFVSGALWRYHGSSLFGTSNTDEVYMTSPVSNGTMIVSFGNSTYGKVPPAGSPIKMSYKKTVGSLANSSVVGLEVKSLDGTFTGVTSSPITDGKEEEDIESIKHNAVKLAYTDDFTKLLTRDNFSSWLVRKYNVIDGKAWGAYEETLRKVPDVTQMNNLWFTIVPKDFKLKLDDMGPGSGTTTMDFTISNSPLVAGSGSVTVEGSSTFSEASGGLGVLCEDNSTRHITGGVAYASEGADTVSNLYDNSPSTSWVTDVTPSVRFPVVLGYKFSKPTVLKAYRLRTSNTVNPADLSVPKAFKVYVTTDTTPDYESDDNWDIVENIEELGLITNVTWSRWLGLDYEEPVTAIKIEITRATYKGLQLSELQILDDTMVSSLDYITGEIHLNSQNIISTDTNVKVTSINYSLTGDYTDLIAKDLTSRTLFTTRANYTSPLARLVDVTLHIKYSQSISASVIRQSASDAIEKLFSTAPVLGIELPLSSIYHAVRTIPGVSSVDVLAPTANILTSNYEFPALNKLTITMEIA